MIRFLLQKKRKISGLVFIGMSTVLPITSVPLSRTMGSMPISWLPLVLIVQGIYNGMFLTPPETDLFDQTRNVYQKYFPSDKQCKASPSTFKTASEPDLFDQMRNVYREYFPNDKQLFEASLSTFKTAVQCGWNIAGTIPYAQPCIKALGSLGLLIAAFAVKPRKAHIAIITPPCDYPKPTHRSGST